MILLTESESMTRLFNLDWQLIADSCLTIIAVMVLFAVFSALLFEPVRKMLNDRKEKIQSELDDAKESMENAHALKAEYEEKLKNVEKEAEAILSEARRKALANENQIVAQAKEEAARILDRARVEAELEKQKMADWWKELFRFYKKQPGFEESLQQLIRGAGYVNEEKGLSKQVAEALYGKKISNSVTRVERYVSCAFAHFLQYGLLLKERYEFRFGGVDFGNIFHDVLRIFPNRLKEKNYTWKTIPVEEMHELIEKCVREVAADYGNAILTSSKRNAYMIERMCRIMKRTLWALSEQIKKGDFEPTDYEVTFSYMDGLENAKMDLGEERIMQLQGRIDRIDQCETDFDSKDAVYVKIIDYKSGSTKFQIDNMYYGLQMQLIVYMNAAMELKKQENPNKEVKTAGIFYYNMEDPIIDRPTNEGKREEEILKELNMDGLVNNKNQVIQLFDRAFGTNGNLEKSVKSLVIPVETTKDGLIGARSSSISEEQFGNMGEYINLLMKKYGKEILEGNTSIYPYEKEDKTACDFCSFKPVCNFDRKLPGNQYRRLEKLSKNQVWDKIKEDLE